MPPNIRFVKVQFFYYYFFKRRFIYLLPCCPYLLLKYLAHLWPAGQQLCHIFTAAVTHFLFPFKINPRTPFTVFTYQSCWLTFRTWCSPLPRHLLLFSFVNPAWFVIGVIFGKGAQHFFFFRKLYLGKKGKKTKVRSVLSPPRPYIFWVHIWHPSAWKYVLMVRPAARHH